MYKSHVLLLLSVTLLQLLQECSSQNQYRTLPFSWIYGNLQQQYYNNLLTGAYSNPNFNHGVGSPPVQQQRRLPDLQLDIGELQRSVHVEVKSMRSLQCAIEERCLSSSAYTNQYYGRDRVLLRLTVTVWNRGTADFFSDQQPRQWDWHACHNHFHSMAEFAHYEILSATSPNQKVAEGHKVSFCLSDSKCSYGRRKYNCNGGRYTQRQGISVGCADAYLANFDCQWIDVTDVQPGRYILKVRLNPNKRVEELNHDNNNVVCDLNYPGRATWAYRRRTPWLASLASNCRVENHSTQG